MVVVFGDLLVEWESIEIGVDWIWGGVGGEMEFGFGWVIIFFGI